MKTVIVTGANGNLGTAVVKTFLSKGYKIIATVHNEDSLKDLPAHQHLESFAVELSNEVTTASFIQSVMQSNKNIDAALLLVGGFAMGNIYSTSTEDIKKQISLNFETAYHVVRPLFQHMIEKNNGRIVFVGARPSLIASAGKDLIAYALAKSLLFKLAEYLNEEAKGKNVTATVVVPGTIDTPANRNSMPAVDPNDWVTPQALAEILEFIISESSAPLRETVLKVYNNS